MTGKAPGSPGVFFGKAHMPATMITLPVLAAMLALASCSDSTPHPDKGYSGWYMQQDTGEYFQACGEPTRYRVDSSELRSRASAFGLGQDNPVYVRLRGRPTSPASMLLVSKVESFGSTTPVRDCPMAGLVIAAPG